MRILQVSGVLCDRHGGGVGDYVCSLSRRLVAEGHEVEIVTYSTTPSKHAEDPFTIHRLPLPPAPLLRFLLWGREANELVRELMGMRKFDLVHAHTTSMGFPLFYDSPTPLVITCHGTSSDPAHRGGRRLLLKVLERRYYEGARRIVAVSHGIARELIGRGVPEHKIEVIPNGTDPTRFGRTRMSREVARDSLSIRPGQLAVLYVGALSKRKGLDVLLDASARILGGENKDLFLFLFVGDGPLKPLAQGQAASQPAMRVLGFVSEAELALCYSASDVFVIPSLYEGMPTTLLDAMTFGLPTIASDIPAHRESLTQDCGVLVASGNVDALTDAILWSERSRSLLTRMGAAALSRSKVFSWSRIAREISRVYAEVVAR